MAEFEFYGTFEDSWTQLERLVAANRFTFLIDMAYKERKPFEFKELTEEIKQILIRHPKVFLWSDVYSRFPPFFTQSNDGIFSIYPLKGGPSLELSFPRSFEHETKTRLVAGYLMHQTSYANAEIGGNYIVPEELRHAYAVVKQILQRNLVKRYAQVHIFRNGLPRDEVDICWIGQNALALLDAGTAEIQIAGQWRKSTDLHANRIR